MDLPKLTLNLNLKEKIHEQEAKQRTRVNQTIEKIKKEKETIEEAWARIFSMKNADVDKERLQEVHDAMKQGSIGRDPLLADKKFSKAEALRLYEQIRESKKYELLDDMVKNTPSNYILVTTDTLFHQMLSDMRQADFVGLDCETYGEDGKALDPWRGDMAGFSVSANNRHYYVPLQHEETTELLEQQGETYIIDTIRPILEGDVKLILHNAPFDAKWFKVYHNIDIIKNIYADTQILSFLLDENCSHRLKDLATNWLKVPSDTFDNLFKVDAFHKVDLTYARAYACKDTDLTLRLFRFCMEWMEKRDDLRQLKKLAFKVEMPVLRQMIQSDLRGICFDVEEAGKVDVLLEQEEQELEQTIKRLLNVEESFNIGSPAQLSKQLFDVMKLPNPNKGATGSKVLKKIKNKHEVIDYILQYRGVSKLRSAFTVKLPKNVKQDGKLHPWHNSLGAKTGRFTAKDPNTQQLPSMTKNPYIRPLFKPSEGYFFVSVDFSQIELRVLAHCAKEPVMIQAFREGKDLHSTTASQVFLSHLPFEEGYAQIEQYKDDDNRPEAKYRKQSKNINFGSVYGISGIGLSEMLGCTVAEAELMLENYFKSYAGIAAYMDEQKAFLHKHGYVVDMFGRKRRLKEDLRSKEKWRISSAERQAGNFGIQSAAGVILKIAITKLTSVLDEIGGHILLQIHDELLFELPIGTTKEQVNAIKDTMENCVKLIVPLKSDVEINEKAWGLKVSEEEFFTKK